MDTWSLVAQEPAKLKAQRQLKFLQLSISGYGRAALLFFDCAQAYESSLLLAFSHIRKRETRKQIQLLLPFFAKTPNNLSFTCDLLFEAIQQLENNWVAAAGEGHWLLIFTCAYFEGNFKLQIRLQQTD